MQIPTYFLRMHLVWKYEIINQNYSIKLKVICQKCLMAARTK